jgi:hypothetical protein
LKERSFYEAKLHVYWELMLGFSVLVQLESLNKLRETNLEVCCKMHKIKVLFYENGLVLRKDIVLIPRSCLPSSFSSLSFMAYFILSCLCVGDSQYVC